MKLLFKTNHTGFKFLKTQSLQTLVPLSSYEKNSNTLISQDIPLFFHVKTEKFVYFLADNFLNDYKLNEIPEYNNYGFRTKGIFVHSDKEDNKYLGFSFNSLKELKDSFVNTQSNFFKFKENYDNHLMDITQGEHVIFVALKNTNVPKHINSGNNHIDSKCITTSHSKFEFFQAFKFNKKYYLIDKNSQLDQSKSFTLDKNTPQEMNYLVIPYTAEDWNILNKVYGRINDIKNNIQTIFENQKEPALLDKPFSPNENTKSLIFKPK